jgi:APA family basic amino acid/polyamine antiporter
MAFWSRKTVQMCAEEAYGESGPRLRRSLGVVGLTAFGVGSTIGAGIFTLTGDIAAHQAGPAVSLSFVLSSIACFFAGLCYAEFAAMVPISGSAYSYSFVTLGEGVAWIIGWSLVLEWLFSASVVAISWSGYASAALKDLGLQLPAVLTHGPFAISASGHWSLSGAWFDMPAVLVVMACTALALAGTRTSLGINTGIVVAKVIALVLIIFVGAAHVHPQNWHPFIPPNEGEFGEFGWSGIARAAGTLFFAYIGFEGVSTLAEEARNPQRTVPWSLFASLLICTVFYVSVSVVVTGLANYRLLGVPDPLYFALSGAGVSLAYLRGLVAVVAIAGLLSVVLASIVGQVRIFYSMARDGLLPPVFGKLSRSAGTPYLATIITGIAAMIMAGMLPLELLGELISIGTLLAFAVVCAGVVILRRIAPQARRPFRAPWVPVIPALGFLSCVALMLSLPAGTWIRLAVWTGLGLAIYALYGRRHSRLSATALSRKTAESERTLHRSSLPP